LGPGAQVGEPLANAPGILALRIALEVILVLESGARPVAAALVCEAEKLRASRVRSFWGKASSCVKARTAAV
jgi:hypothetical protein